MTAPAGTNRLNGKTLLRSPLSKREAEVLILARDGMPNDAIGRALDIAEQSVKMHLYWTAKKLGAKNRTHSVVIAITEGWIPLF